MPAWKHALALLLVAVILPAPPVAATPPANDEIANATVIGAVPYETSVGTGTATSELSELLACPDGVAGGLYRASVWYRYVPGADGTITAGISAYHPVMLAIYLEAPNRALVPVDCSAASKGGVNLATASARALAGQTYFFQVTSKEGWADPVALDVNCGPASCGTPPPLPPLTNDDFAAAAVVTSTPYADAGSTQTSTTETGEPRPCSNIGSTVWYQYTAPSDGTLIADTFQSAFDTVLAIYSGTSMGSLTLQGCNNNNANTLQSRLRIPIYSGVTYMIQAGGVSGAKGILFVHLAVAPPVPPPPSNDDLDAAIDVTLFPFSIVQSNVGATLEVGEQRPCNADGTVWYTWTPPFSTVGGTLSADTFGSNFDTVIAAYVFIGQPAGPDQLINVACNNDWPTAGTASRLLLPIVPGLTYYFQVGGANILARGSLEFHLSQFA